MKLFQWVHRKFWQNSTDSFKDFKFGNPCSCLTLQPTPDSHYSHANPSFNSITQSRFSKPYQQGSQTSYSEYEDKRAEEKSQEETSMVISEIFEGFLTIGTLGAETITEEPATPEFSMPLEKISERNAAVTENDLKRFSYELERFLEAEHEEGFYESSGRNSYISTITLSGKKMDGAEDEDYGNITACPLQGYLLGSSIEFPETTEVRKERASLAELFERTKKTNQDLIESGGSGEMQVKQTHKSVTHIMKKMLKKVNTSSKRCPTPEGDAGSTSTNKKLNKVLRMFHRKVYPENSIKAKDFNNSHKGKIEKVPHDHSHVFTGDPARIDKSRIFCPESRSRKWSQHCETNWIPPKYQPNCISADGNREHWIKTDADCKF
ncbi:protein LAZY 1-like [Senna tora]|uniref:Protein LAZY 1-like n=1 Tax=Senna tora TaxID=362788 RepID=A0A834TE15_9FABA|nr:protein LAZY 1-like [Senna tora]